MQKIVTVIIIAALATVSFTGCGSVSSLFSKESQKVIPFPDDKYGQIVCYEKEFESFSRLDLDVSFGDVYLEKGDKFKLKYCYPEKLVPDYEIKDSSLIVRGKRVMGISNEDGREAFLTITVPDDIWFNMVRLDSGMGDIKIDGITGKDLNVDALMGNVTVSDSTFEKVSIKNSMGDVKFDYVTAKLVDGAAAMGNVNISTSSVNEVKWNNSMGNVTIDGNFENLRINNSMGDIYVNCEENWKGKLYTTMGVVSVNGQSHGETYSR
ncbi:Putative adhesin [Butyrivibrio proteoclasticus]|uniref:Putative adhesin n=1 Tax=Butyrivibrio proteoclasticus TaxID=43305 RepID=A0A1I5UT98_9FIRM|nr:DUF4097 family beta strand repeat-containing protein [Butyrivibrio proteoclasticus]SFP98247.1 Putative adhesin [Butyrivibrio proteoclasticus]